MLISAHPYDEAMWYSRNGALMIFIAGIVLIAAGCWQYSAENTAVGILLIVVGIPAAVIGITVLSVHMRVARRKK